MASRPVVPGHSGRAAEDRACAFLVAKGLTLVTRNFRCRQGEIDLIMEEGKTLVFVEVRLRRDSRFGNAIESIDSRKQRRIATAAQFFLLQNPSISQRPCRFDVVALDGNNALEWLENAFDVS